MAAHLLCITSTHDTLTRHTGNDQAATKQNIARSSVPCTHGRADIRQHQNKQNSARSSVFCHETDCGSTLILCHQYTRHTHTTCINQSSCNQTKHSTVISLLLLPWTLTDVHYTTLMPDSCTNAVIQRTVISLLLRH